MRAIECPCGHHLEGADNEDLSARFGDMSTATIPSWIGPTSSCAKRIAADAYDGAPVP